VSRRELYDEWTLDEVLDAHDVMDLYEELEAKAAEPKAK
jgi:hypothetical protein